MAVVVNSSVGWMPNHMTAPTVKAGKSVTGWLCSICDHDTDAAQVGGLRVNIQWW